MSYTYDDIQLDCIDSSGTVLYNIDTFTASTIPAVPIEGFAIGNKIRLTLTITSSGSNSFINKFLRFNPGLFVLFNRTNAFDFGYQTLNPLSTTPQQAVLNVTNPALDNIYCEMSNNAAPHDVATVVFEFYITNDTNNFIFGYSSNTNVNRFLTSILSVPNNQFQSIYNAAKNIGIATRVFDPSGFSAIPTTPAGGNFLNLPVEARWYNSDYLGYSLLMRYIRELEISSASQIAAGLQLLTDATATAAQPNQTTIPNYISSSSRHNR